MSELALPSPAVAELPRAERLLSDELLARLVGRGNERAFAALYERHHQSLYRYCRSIVRDEHDAHDALQATMMQAYAALRVKERDLAVRAWLFRIAHNESISLLRKRRGGPRPSEDADALGADLEATVEARARLSALVADLRELPERQRAALIMRELSGLRIEEIAEALSTSPAAAKQALFEARNSLREIEQGREMPCERVRKALSARDGRTLRGRRIKAHLRACTDCRAFGAAIGEREAGLRLLAPALPSPAAGAILGKLLAGGGHLNGGSGAVASSGASLAGTSGAASSGSSLIGHLGGSLLGKGLAAVAVVAGAAAGTARLAEVGPSRPASSGASHSSHSSHHAAGAAPNPEGRAAGSEANQAAHRHGARSTGASRLPAGLAAGGSAITAAGSGAVRQGRGKQERGLSGPAQAGHAQTGSARGRGKEAIDGRAHGRHGSSRKSQANGGRAHGGPAPPATHHQSRPPAGNGAGHAQGAGAGKGAVPAQSGVVEGSSSARQTGGHGPSQEAGARSRAEG